MTTRCVRAVLVSFLAFAGPAWAMTSDMAAAEAPDSLTVEESVRLVLETHPAVQQAVHGLDAAAARVRESESALSPDLSGEASYTRIGPVPSLAMPGGELLKFYPENNYDLHLGLRQTVLDFGRRATGVQLARAGQQSAGEDVELIKSDLAYRTIGVFYSILFLKQNVAVLDQQIEALREHILVTQKKVRAGTATDFDVLTTQVRMAAVRNQRIDASNMLEKQRTAFRELIGVAPEAPVTLRGDFSVVPVPLAADSLTMVAMERLPEMRLSKSAETSAGLQLQLASLGDKPSVDVNLLYGLKNGFVPDLDALKDNWVAGADLHVPIFNGHRRRSRVQEATASMNAARAHTRALERRIAAGIKQAVADVQASREKLETSELQVKQAEDAVSIAEVRYEAGVVTNLDLLDAQTSVANAKLARLKALYDFVCSRYDLERAIGERQPLR